MLQVKADKRFDGDDIATAAGILCAIQKKEFVFMLAFMNKFLNLIAPADKILQSTEIGFREALPVIHSVKKHISELRLSESFNLIWKESDEIQEMSATLESENASERTSRREITRPSWLTGFILTDRTGERNRDNKIEISSAYYFVIDVFLSEIAKRFENNSEILTAMSCAEEFDIKLLKPLEDIGLTLPSHEEMVVAKTFIATRKKIHKEEMSKLCEQKRVAFKNRFSLLKELYKMKDAFPEVYKFMATLDTFGCSTATCESSFSALERLNRKTRMSMKNARLRHLSFLAFEKKRLQNISIDDILYTFSVDQKRKVQLY